MKKQAIFYKHEKVDGINIFYREAGNRSNIERYGEPEEIAELMAFLLSPAAKWMTGTAVRMDGGEVKGI